MTKTRSFRIRMMSLILSILFLLPVFPAVAEEAPIRQEKAHIVACLVYAGATTASRTIGRLADGTEITVYGTSGDYYKIDCYDTNGYIAISQVSKSEIGEYYVSCREESDHTVEMEVFTATESLLTRAAILELAKAELGDPYIYGATGPNGFDCSGFAGYVYKKIGHPLARICSGQMAAGLIVSRDLLEVGDLIFFGGSAESVFHVGIYAGDGQIIHASSSKGISYADLESAWFAGNYLCARRLIVQDGQADMTLLLRTTF